MSEVKKTSKSLWKESWERLQKNKVAVVSMYVIGFVCFMGAFAKLVSPYPFDEQNIDVILSPPSLKYWLGTDSLGRDLLSRIIYGARISMMVAILSSFLSLLWGGIYGAISGWVGGKTDSVLMRFVDILYSIPSLVLMILVKVIFDSFDIIENPELKALVSMLLALSVAGWVTLARIVRGQVLQVKQMAYVEASRAAGASSLRILIKDIAPNILGPIIILLTIQIPGNILFEAFLSFIGLGLQPPFSSWGVLANEGWKVLRSYPHLMISPGVVMFITLLAFSYLGDGLRDAFDPQLKGRVGKKKSI